VLTIAVTINGHTYERAIEPRLLLSDFLRHEIGLTGTHVGCEHGVCGACTILFDDEPARSCIMLAAQADGHHIRTVEGLAGPGGELNGLQTAFREAHGLQCGFCTPGILMTMTAFLRDRAQPPFDAAQGGPGPVEGPGEAEIRDMLSGNLCRCTGYQHIVDAVQQACQSAR
jgi:carbon-monoxide dehydrogenase small subunit